MSKPIAITCKAYEDALERQLDALRAVIVLGCGAALIFAGQALPF